MTWKKPILYVFLFLAVIAFSGSAYALSFTGDAWVARHDAGGVSTGEFFLVIDNSGYDINANKVKLKGFKFKTSTAGADFFGLTNQRGNEGLTYFEIDTARSKKYKKYAKKAKKKAKKMVKKGLLSEDERQEWMDDYINDKLEAKLFKLIFKDMDGDKYKAKIGYATFENPYLYDDGESYPEGNAAPVPEPTTLILLGTGLFGIATLRKRFIK